MRTTLLAVAFLSLLASSATAQSRTLDSADSLSAGTARGTHTVTYKDRTLYDFDAEEVVGTLQRPDSEIVTGRVKSRHESLVQPRGSFIPELLHSVEQL